MTLPYFSKFIAAAVVVFLVACAQPAGSPRGTGTSHPNAASSDLAWEEVVDAARKEGTVAVLAPIGTEIREALVDSFEKTYGITVDYYALRGAELTVRVGTERDAGKYLWDVYVGGTTTGIASLKPMGALDPLEPTLVLPEVTEPTSWLTGKRWFADKDQHIVLLGLTTRPAFAVNTSLARGDEFTSFRDLLDPRWKGRILLGRDPRQAGPGQAIFTFFMMHPDLGPEYVRALVQQDLALVGEDRQAVDWLGQGRYALLLGPPETVTEDFIQRGAPIQLVAPQQLREGGDLSPGPGAMALMNRAPHPNAARVYVNWLLSREGQEAFSKATGIPSLRTDVSMDHLVSWRRPVTGYLETYTEDAIAAKDSLLALLSENMR